MAFKIYVVSDNANNQIKLTTKDIFEGIFCFLIWKELILITK